MSLPNLTTTTFTPLNVLIDTTDMVFGSTIVLDSGNTDTGSTPNSMFRDGNVVGLRTSTGRYVEANDANCDNNTTASITSSGHSDGNGDIDIVYRSWTISVTTSTGSGTEANNATDLNADADFAAFFTASSGSGELTIATNFAGADQAFYVAAATMATAGFAEGVANFVRGTDADYRVTYGNPDSVVDLLDHTGTARHNEARNLVRAHFDYSNLVNMTPDALECLVRRGARFG